ncbi:MAG TPA: hypothetical protein VLB12_08315 [Gemmatimonadales bacterium]|nr:hypothetical protein [Gemmatimonadales bacterium]
MSSHRLLALLVLVGCSSSTSQPPANPSPTPGGPPAAQPNEPAPAGKGLQLRNDGTFRYSLWRRDSVVAQMPSGEAQIQVTGQTAFVTVSLQPATDGARLTATLDSVRPDPDVTISIGTLDSISRSQWSGQLTRSGWVESVSATTHSLLADQIRDAIKLLFPVLADNAGAGSTWHSSAPAVAARLSVVDLDESVQVVGTAGAAANENGQKFIPITVIRTTTGQGSGSQAGQPIDLAATGRDSLVYQLGNDGQVLGAEGARVRDMTLTATAVGQTVPVTQESRLKFLQLR